MRHEDFPNLVCRVYLHFSPVVPHFALGCIVKRLSRERRAWDLRCLAFLAFVLENGVERTGIKSVS